MIVPQASWDAYNRAVEAQAGEAARRMRTFLATLDFTGDYESKKAARDLAIEFFKELVGIYGDAAATLAADFYEELAEAAGEGVPPAALVEPAEGSMEGSVRYAACNLFGQQASVPLFMDAVERSVRTFVKKMANDTMSANAVRDGAKHGVRFARVPTGPETCAFCITLASRGFVYASPETAGEFDHYHDDCDCRVVAGFGDDAGVDGYDPEVYRDIYYRNVKYDEYGHVLVEDTLNSIRREMYPLAKDARNARRRELRRIRSGSDGVPDSPSD